VKKLLGILLLVPSLGTARYATAQVPELSVSDIVARSAAAVVTIKTFDAQGQAIGLGSGFRVSSGRLVTNAHVVAGASRIEVFDNNEQLLGTAGFAEAVSTTVDLAVLPRLGTRTAQLPVAASIPRVGERVVVIGAPEGLSNTVSDGLVSALRSVEGRNLLQISAPISPGSSGGPVLNARGEVVGVSVSILREGQNLNFAVPVTDVVAMLGSPAGRVAFPPESNARASRSDAAPRQPVNLVRLGESVNGSLTADDQTLQSGTKFDSYNIQLTGGTRVTVSVHSRDIDSYVFVFQRVGDSLVTVAFDDDSGGGLDAEANFVAPATAYYTIDVLSASEHGQTGDYSLTVQTGARTNAAGSLASSASTDGARWVTTGRSSTGNTFSYDRTRIQPMGSGVYRVWTRRELDSPADNTAGDYYDRALSMDEIDCRRSRTRMVQLFEYLHSKLVYSSDSAPSEWSAIVPETVGETHFQTLCRYVAARGL
jgi:serine protease Do